LEIVLLGVDKWGTHEGVSRSNLSNANRRRGSASIWGGYGEELRAFGY